MTIHRSSLVLSGSVHQNSTKNQNHWEIDRHYI